MIGVFLNQTVTIKPKASTAYDKWGNPIAGTPASVSARVQEIEKRIQTSPDTYVDIKLQVWLAPSQTLESEDIITWNSTDYRVVQVEKKYDLFGVMNHVKVSCR